jgi:hypothetical protein
MKRLLAVALLGCAAAVGYSAPASAEDAPFIDWNPLFPGIATPYRPSREKDCVDGSNACIEETLTEMYRRFDRNYAVCDHNAAFGITYIRVTEGVRAAVLRGDLYEEPTFLNHEDKVFARMYFNSFDAWKRGDRARVPPAWRLALDAGRDKTNAGIGDLLMSMNAHINRDMPFMLEALGLTRPDGVNRKLDHDKGNRVLAPLFDDVLKELADRFDFSTDKINIPGTLIDDMTLFQVLQLWREQVWRNAEMLGAAQSPAGRKAVGDFIENYSLLFGNLIRTMTTIMPGPAKLRDAHCADYKRTHRETGGLLHTSVAKRGLRARKAAVRLRVTCPELRDCTGTAFLTRRGKPVSSARRVSLRPGGSVVVALRLKRSSMKAVRAGGRLAVRAATASPSPWGSTRTTSLSTRVRG